MSNKRRRGGTTVRKQAHASRDQIKTVNNSKRHLTSVADVHDQIVDNALHSIRDIKDHCMAHRAKIDEAYVTPLLLMVIDAVNRSTAMNKALREKIKALRVNDSDPIGSALNLLDDLNKETQHIGSNIVDPMLDIMEAINKNLPEEDRLDMREIEDLMEVLDRDDFEQQPVSSEIH